MAPRTVDDVIRDLRAFTPDPRAPDLCYQLYEVLDGFRSMAGRERAVPAIFDLLERGADADLGSPGPLVHELEAIAGFEEALGESLGRRPTFLTVRSRPARRPARPHGNRPASSRSSRAVADRHSSR